MAGLHFFLTSLETARTCFVPPSLTPSLSSTSLLLLLIFLEVVHLVQWKSFIEQTGVNPHNFWNSWKFPFPCATNTVLGASFARKWLLTPLKSPGSRTLHQEINYQVLSKNL